MRLSKKGEKDHKNQKTKFEKPKLNKGRIIRIGVFGGIFGLLLVSTFVFFRSSIGIPNFVAFILGGIFSGALTYKKGILIQSLYAGLISALTHSVWSLINLSVIYPLMMDVSLSGSHIFLTLTVIILSTLITYSLGSIIGYGLVHLIKNKIMN
ncbi:hypothetical protein HN587_01220 [Candidatus Woesearchaeota archaeon]|jgi:hypothetical protein|nr:hypothetical protein [Candidatus Woesearchaeota archaeon]